MRFNPSQKKSILVQIKYRKKHKGTQSKIWVIGGEARERERETEPKEGNLRET